MEFFVKVPRTAERFVMTKTRTGKARRKRYVDIVGFDKKGPFATFEEAARWIHNNTSFSVHEATERQGYDIVTA